MKNKFTKLKSGLLAAALALGFAGSASAQTLLSESFTGTGIPTGWTNTPYVGTTAFVRGTTGSSAGSFPSTFTGPSVANGYLVYDSDFIANAAGDSVILTTPVIDATGKNIVFLKFSEFYREFNSTAYVQVSNNNTTWTTVHTTDAGLAANASTPNPNLVNVDISAVAANQATVYVRFVYSSTAAGGAYQWFLDDIEVFSPTAGTSDLAVGQIYTLGKLPLSATGTPHVVSARITNAGANLVASETVTLTVTGTNPFTTTATVTNLAAGATQLVTFPGYTPTTIGTDTVRVTVPADLVNTNNTGTVVQRVTASTISYAVGNPPVPSTAFGFTNGNAAFYVKYTNNSTTASSVPVIRALVGMPGAGTNTTVGKTLYAVLLNASGTVITQSAPVVITAAQIGTLVDFPMGPSIIPANSEFYVGLVQPTGGHFPMGLQAEDPARPATYFTGGINGGTLTALAAPNNNIRFVIEADLTAAPTSINDARVHAVYVLGKTSTLGSLNPYDVQAVITNTGTTTMTNLVVSATAVGTNAGALPSQTIASLASGASTTVTFPLTITNTGVTTINVTLPADDNTNNNTGSAATTGTASIISYATNAAPTSGVGFLSTAANRAFLNRHEVKGSNPVIVQTVRAFIYDDVNVVGKTVFAVVVDSSGTEIGRSANVVLQNGDLDAYYPFVINYTGNPSLENTVFYAGLAMAPYSGATVFPMGYQNELPQRSNAYYTWQIGSTTKPTASVPTGTNPGRRYMIEVDFGSTTGLKDDLNAGLVSVYPNPSNGIVNISAKDMKGGNNVALEVRDMQGRVVYTGSIAKDGGSVKLNKLAAGVYMMRVSTDAQVAVKRLVIQ